VDATTSEEDGGDWMRVSDWGGEDEHHGESEDDDGDEWSCGRIEGLSPLRSPRG
jgi:hypothetical protein